MKKALILIFIVTSATASLAHGLIAIDNLNRKCNVSRVEVQQSQGRYQIKVCEWDQLGKCRLLAAPVSLEEIQKAEQTAAAGARFDISMIGLSAIPIPASALVKAGGISKKMLSLPELQKFAKGLTTKTIDDPTAIGAALDAASVLRLSLAMGVELKRAKSLLELRDVITSGGQQARLTTKSCELDGLVLSEDLLLTQIEESESHLYGTSKPQLSSIGAP